MTKRKRFNKKDGLICAPPPLFFERPQFGKNLFFVLLHCLFDSLHTQQHSQCIPTPVSDLTSGVDVLFVANII